VAGRLPLRHLSRRRVHEHLGQYPKQAWHSGTWPRQLSPDWRAIPTASAYKSEMWLVSGEDGGGCSESGGRQRSLRRDNQIGAASGTGTIVGRQATTLSRISGPQARALKRGCFRKSRLRFRVRIHPPSRAAPLIPGNALSSLFGDPSGKLADLASAAAKQSFSEAVSAAANAAERDSTGQ
jgi:hypothetical protein